MRVCFVTASASRQSYGVLPAMIGAAHSLRALGHDVSVVAGLDEYLRSDLPAWKGIQVEALRQVGPRALHYAPELYDWMAQQPRFDAVVLHGVWISMHRLALKYARERGVPVVLAPHGMLSRWSLERSRFKKALARKLYVDRLLRGCACFLANSEGEVADALAASSGAPVALVPHGVELPHLVSASEDGQRQTRTLAFLGRIHPKKGVGPLIDAWKESGAQDRKWRLAIAGPDQLGLVDELRGRAAGQAIEFCGPLFGAEKDEFLRNADAFILPSQSEGLPVAVLEAWSYGLPVVMTKACNLSVGFSRAAAIEVEPTAASIAAGLHQLFAFSQQQRQAMGSRGRALVEDEYSWGSVGQRLEQLLGWLVGVAPTPSFVSGADREAPEG
jgi:glycosyltransferase involved in cell wall biosynthesis